MSAHSLKPRADHILRLYRRALDNAGGAPARTAQALAAPQPTPEPAPPLDPPEELLDWLAQLTLLYGVPFEYLVADADMLPAEGLRFFYVDDNWLHRLVDGAVNAGVASSRDSLQVLSEFENLTLAAALRRPAVRATLRGQVPPTADGTGTVLTGLLLRSEVVSGWPGLEVSAWSDAEGTVPLPLLRMDRPSADVLLCLFAGVPALVDFLEPPESLHFGVLGIATDPTGDPCEDCGSASLASGQDPCGAIDGPAEDFSVALRGLGHGGHAAGIQFSDPVVTVGVPLRKGAAGVLDVAALAGKLKSCLACKKALDAAGTFSSAEMAVELVRPAGMQSFKTGVTAGETAPAPAPKPLI